MKVTVYGVNYTGAHFRGIPDKFDSKDVKVVLIGDEIKITQFISANFSYSTDDMLNVVDFVKLLKDGNVPIFDGCGGILFIHDENDQEIFFLEDMDVEQERAKKSIALDLGEVNVDEVKDYFDHVNGLIEKFLP